MTSNHYRVLFLCTHNSARSILAEGLMNQIGAGKFIAYSAGSTPSGKVNPFAVKTLEALGCDTSKIRSKHWDEFAAPDAPQMDFIFTVCDNAAGEVCPVWPGHPATVHWGFSDPSATVGNDDIKHAAFAHTAELIAERLRQFAALPIEQMDRATLIAKLRELSKQ